ncbi:hypothetical protein Smp_192060 [Schistosoma mansoni]|uniref:hypothetical protein n=1 Tax=Schistosoma mansoni TaxID=6183 RepID=UPI00022C83CD|nr:hypothetical protein Smp_192060 [Schistosoma mansoni]|eukprot:XP_018644598.1 hypothetical protein Smp_192060 [Schistosoma mansoni]
MFTENCLSVDLFAYTSGVPSDHTTEPSTSQTSTHIPSEQSSQSFEPTTSTTPTHPQSDSSIGVPSDHTTEPSTSQTSTHIPSEQSSQSSEPTTSTTPTHPQTCSIGSHNRAIHFTNQHTHSVRTVQSIIRTDNINYTDSSTD